MTAKRLQWILALVTAIGGSVLLYAQNPVSISQVGTTAVTTTVPVSGTVTANAGTGTLTVGQATGSNLHVVVDTAPTTAVTGTFWQATQPVSGTVTANAGTGTLTVGQATGSNLHIVCDSGCSSSTAPADESTFTAGTTSHSPIGGFFQTTPTNNALTNGQMGAMQLTAQRAVFSNLRNASGTEVGTSSTPLQVTLANTGANSNHLLVTPDANSAVNVAQMNGVTTSMNAGSPDAGTQRVVLADGASEGAIVSAASTNATSVKGSAAQFFGYELYNTTTTVYYLRLYNLSTAPTCSSATGFIRAIPIPPAGAAGQVGGAVRMAPIGVSYGTGLAYCLTGGSSSTDNTNAAVGVFGALLYR